eukprot:m.256157 g.256157  ORF g.256157 m.256157 type:complete len:562 (+) comp19169_c0_seq6:1177-2862(+)
MRFQLPPLWCAILAAAAAAVAVPLSEETHGRSDGVHDGAACARCIHTVVGAPQQASRVATGMNFDTPVNVVNVSDNTLPLGWVLRGYTGNSNSFRIIDGPNVTSMLPGPDEIGGVGLPVGLNRSATATDLDHCGAWLNAAVSQLPGDPPNMVRGFYHEEWECDYAHNAFTNKSIAYAESTDGGKTFVKVGHPHNQVILPPLGNTTATAAAGQQIGEGDHGVVHDPVSGYLYLFFTEWDQPPHHPVRIGVARSPTARVQGDAKPSAGNGLPGTWTKFYNGQWTEPGEGGMSSALANITGTHMVGPRPGMPFYISIGQQLGHLPGHGIRLAFSTTPAGAPPLAWEPMQEPLISMEPTSWFRQPNSTELFGYSALIPQVDAASGRWSTTKYWLFYTYLRPGTLFSQRLLVRRPVTLTVADSPLPTNAPTALVTLQQTVCPGTNTRSTDWWATTTLVTSNYTTQATLGALMTAPGSDRRPLLDCLIKGTQDHMVGVTETECHEPGVQRLRLLGYLFTKPGPKGTTAPLYRCYNNATRMHHATLNATCDGDGHVEFCMGHLPQVRS